jgi:hypothetical protein
MRGLMTSVTIGTVGTLVLLASGCSSGSSSSASPAPAASSSSTAAQATGSGQAAAPSSAAGSQGGSSGGTVKDPCTLVTAADASTALGGTVPASTSSFTGTYQACSYATSAGNTITVTARLITRTGFDASIKQNAVAPTPAPGLCQDGYVAGSNYYAWQNGTEVDARFVPAVSNLATLAKTLLTTACGRV